MEGGGGYQLREEAAHYIPLFGFEKDNIAAENTYFVGLTSLIYTRCFGPTPDATDAQTKEFKPKKVAFQDLTP